MIKGKLKVFNVGAEWFYMEMKKQDIDIYKIRWSPPVEIPEDISKILSALGRR